MKKKYEVNGMMCAACQANVERAVAHLNGVSSVNVSLLGKNMVVEYDDAVVSSQEIIKAVDDSGYSCSIFVNQSTPHDKHDKDMPTCSGIHRRNDDIRFREPRPIGTFGRPPQIARTRKHPRCHRSRTRPSFFKRRV